MIQRVQTLWLTMAILCMAACFIFPTAEFKLVDPTIDQVTTARLDLIARSNPEMYDQIVNMEPTVVFSQKDKFNTWPLLVLSIATMAVAAVSIFLFGKRTVQIKVVMVAFLFNLAYAFVVFFWAVDSYANVIKDYMRLNDITVSWSIGAFAPLASLIFLFLAQRAIRKDEALVRAADRLR